MSRQKSLKSLVGRTITAVEMNGWYDHGVTTWIYKPVFTLDDGSRVTFHAQETDHGADYGVIPMHRPRDGR